MKHRDFVSLWIFNFVSTILSGKLTGTVIFEPPCGKTNNVVSEQVRHKPGCTVTEKG